MWEIFQRTNVELKKTMAQRWGAYGNDECGATDFSGWMGLEATNRKKKGG